MKFVYDKCNYQSDKLHFKNVKALEKLDKVYLKDDKGIKMLKLLLLNLHIRRA